MKSSSGTTEGDVINWIVALVIASLLLIFLTGIVSTSLGYSRGYQMGQIDALNGSIHWQLQRQADGQMLWVECENVCEEK